MFQIPRLINGTLLRRTQQFEWAVRRVAFNYDARDIGLRSWGWARAQEYASARVCEIESIVERSNAPYVNGIKLYLSTLIKLRFLRITTSAMSVVATWAMEKKYAIPVLAAHVGINEFTSTKYSSLRQRTSSQKQNASETQSELKYRVKGRALRRLRNRAIALGKLESSSRRRQPSLSRCAKISRSSTKVSLHASVRASHRKSAEKCLI